MNGFTTADTLGLIDVLTLNTGRFSWTLLASVGYATAIMLLMPGAARLWGTVLYEIGISVWRAVSGPVRRAVARGRRPQGTPMVFYGVVVGDFVRTVDPESRQPYTEATALQSAHGQRGARVVKSERGSAWKAVDPPDDSEPEPRPTYSVHAEHPDEFIPVD